VRAKLPSPSREVSDPPTAESTRGRKVLSGLAAVVVTAVIVMVDMGISGFVVFTNAAVDPLVKADAIIVLGGEHDGREDYGLSLARAGWAPTVVLSNPYPDDDPVMRRVCNVVDVDVSCLRPEPLTTRGEALFARRLADERHWQRVIVVSWRYHLPRARLVFAQCFASPGTDAVFAEMPRRYQFSWLEWEAVYAYQWGGLAKAVVQGKCA
jgi:uncharacterized SAM-binding protein YcdF (DUF218 family)